ncbi:hypothetical protein niasHT_002125 [Heterodera trifolii]|uniref:LIM zinc-binding domain-containing protein n=1 Tax=Heterodera trifolii TaxID=157864 RepID=A0ABD2MEC5_9BILA
MLSNSNYSKNKTAASVTAGFGHRQRTFTAAGRASAVQSIGQLLQQHMDNYCNGGGGGGRTVDENRRIGAVFGEQMQRNDKWGDSGGGGMVQLVDANNNAGERRQFCCWKDDANCYADVADGTDLEEQNDQQHKQEQEQQLFRCCAVCGGRIWQSDVDNANKMSPILGDCHQQQVLKLDWGEELLLVHSACFRCATCGLDLLGVDEQQVVKRADRFYCALHGQQQQRLIRQQQKQHQKVHGHGNDDDNNLVTKTTARKMPLSTPKLSNCAIAAHNDGTAAAWKRGAKMTTTTNMTTTVDEQQHNHSRSSSYGEKCSNKNNNGGDEHHLLLQKWWERRTEEFNGVKGSTTFRYYGSNNIGQRRSSSVKVAPPVPPKLSSLSSNVGIGNRMEMMSNDGKRKNTDDGNSSVGRERQKSAPPMGEEDRCEQCGIELSGSFVLAKGRCWCPEHFVCANSACGRRLLESGFVEEPQGRKNYCPICYECLMAPVCRKCFLPLMENCLNALGDKWHNECFTCTHCRKPFGTLSFFVENGKPYCEEDWNLLFTTKCSDCLKPIKVGQKWLEALGGQFHADCFKCATCGTGLEGKTYFERDQQPFCRVHATAASAVAM